MGYIINGVWKNEVLGNKIEFEWNSSDCYRYYDLELFSIGKYDFGNVSFGTIKNIGQITGLKKYGHKLLFYFITENRLKIDNDVYVRMETVKSIISQIQKDKLERL